MINQLPSRHGSNPRIKDKRAHYRRLSAKTPFRLDSQYTADSSIRRERSSQQFQDRSALLGNSQHNTFSSFRHSAATTGPIPVHSRSSEKAESCLLFDDHRSKPGSSCTFGHRCGQTTRVIVQLLGRAHSTSFLLILDNDSADSGVISVTEAAEKRSLSLKPRAEPLLESLNGSSLVRTAERSRITQNSGSELGTRLASTQRMRGPTRIIVHGHRSADPHYFSVIDPTKRVHTLNTSYVALQKQTFSHNLHVDSIFLGSRAADLVVLSTTEATESTFLRTSATTRPISMYFRPSKRPNHARYSPRIGPSPTGSIYHARPSNDDRATQELTAKTVEARRGPRHSLGPRRAVRADVKTRPNNAHVAQQMQLGPTVGTSIGTTHATSYFEEIMQYRPATSSWHYSRTSRPIHAFSRPSRRQNRPIYDPIIVG
ncbi:hypothetical protein BC834DRAFT_848712 [Gloeopeniophorella convolvens]|nr:hypothetical protein BC834DRAFT_848712 [Gloeopeniophorella convolvens]